MAYPTGVVTRTVSSGDSSTVEGGHDLITEMRVRASRSLIWDGHPMRASQEVVRSLPGEPVTAALPVCDQSGYRDGMTGAVIDVSAEGSVTHTYAVMLRFLRVVDGRELEVGRREIAAMPLPTGDGSPVDVDLLIETGTAPGLLVSVPDSWSARLDTLEAGGVGVPSGAAVGDVLTWTADGLAWEAGGTGGGITVLNNGDGTLSLDGASVLNNLDGTLTIGA